MEKRNSLVKKPSVLLAAALVLISTGMASAATRQHARSSTNVQDGSDPPGMQPRTRFPRTAVRRV